MILNELTNERARAGVKATAGNRQGCASSVVRPPCATEGARSKKKKGAGKKLNDLCQSKRASCQNANVFCHVQRSRHHKQVT